MAQVLMQAYRGTSDYLDTISNVNGQILYDEDTHQILLDNGTTREQYGGGNEKVYDTYAEAVADLANIAEGQTVFVKEGSSNELAQRVNDLETDLGDKATASAVSGDDAFAKINTLNTHLSSLIVSETITGTTQTITPATNTKFTLNCAKAGYRVLSFNVINTGTTLFDVVSQSLGNDSITIVVDNIDTTSHGFTPRIDVWYIKE